MFEKMQVGTADGEDFGSVLQLDRTATGLGAADFVDLFNIYDGGAMDPPKSFAIQTIDQVFDGFVDQGPSPSSVTTNVYLLSALK